MKKRKRAGKRTIKQDKGRVKEARHSNEAQRKRLDRLENFPKKTEKLKTTNKPLERNKRISEQGANRSNEERKFRKRLEKLKIRSKPLERN